MLPLTKLNLDFAVTQVISSLKVSDPVTNKEIQEFKDRAQEFIVEMLSKLFARSSLGSHIFRFANTFDTTSLLELSKEKL